MATKKLVTSSGAKPIAPGQSISTIANKPPTVTAIAQSLLSVISSACTNLKTETSAKTIAYAVSNLSTALTKLHALIKLEEVDLASMTMDQLLAHANTLMQKLN